MENWGLVSITVFVVISAMLYAGYQEFFSSN
jgi:hypothetical protein